MKTVIISGAGGFVGSELTKKMIENDINVIAVSMHFSDTFPQSELVTRIETDISNTDKLLSLIPTRSYEAFYHLAWAGVNGPQKADPLVQLENIKMTMRCAKVAKQLECKKFLCSGTVAEKAVESLPLLEKTSGGMIYGVAKHCTHIMLETYCKNIGLPFVWMQFSNIYGPQNKTGNLVSYTLGELLQGKEATFGPAEQPYDFIYVDDLIEAVCRLGLYETRENCYLIGSGEPRILKDYLTEIGERCGKPELVKIGVRPDDGIIYKSEMFDNSKLTADIGEYVKKPFSESIMYTIEKF
jgi:nucleoside-diphosphate-sugar epimerase